ncbi:MAG TPA: CDP-alcohol phosphatidyltransferase family protein [Sandaracinaceae bacterium LLY-WYZ-13_1]|nr:CDP-alcohol phosphatidyltransferase family protein [Sandaracinaceae bacterium LLY-WYZ-13_1]
MAETETDEGGAAQGEATPERPRRRHFALLREFALADFITLANGAAGTGAILLCLRYVAGHDGATMWTALALFPVALVCDVLDGSVARWRRRSSPLGADLDSLADVVSFGVAPAVLAYTLGMRGGWDAVVLLYFVSCGIGRLARFNATADDMMTEKGKVSHFEGTPIPTSLLLVAVLAAAFGTGAVHERLWLGAVELGPWTLHPLVGIYALSGSAMISATLRIPKP